MSELKPGDFIAGEYRVRKVFGGQGKSGMGVVYLVEGKTSEMPFVLKTFQSRRSDPASLTRFKAEAETWINLGKHPNIVQCHWIREFNDQLFLAAEYVWPDDAGRNILTDHIASGGDKLRQQLNWIAHFCFGMKHAMANGMKAHRDVKPDNLMVDNRGRLLITDFGFAKGRALSEPCTLSLTGDTEQDGLTVAGAAFGTPPYMPPEQFVDSAAVDHRADIYSLGVVIYMLISEGRMPIVLRSTQEKDRFRQWELAHNQQRVVPVDHPLMPLAAKCLEKHRDRRFQSYDEILAAVAGVCRKHNVPLPLDTQDNDAEFKKELGIAMSLVNLDRPEEAVSNLRHMQGQWPESPEIYNELSRAYLGLGKIEEALAATKRALQLDPYSTADWNNFGGILSNLGRVDEAKNAFGKALQIDKENTGAMMGLVPLLMREGALLDAKKWCEVALFWRPEKQLVLQVAADCYYECREFALTVQLLDKLIAKHPDDAIAWVKRGNALSQLGKFDEAIGSYNKAIEAAPQTQMVWKARGGPANGIIGAVPADIVEREAWNGKGLVLKGLGRIREALTCFQEAHNLGAVNAARGVAECRQLLQADVPPSVASATNTDVAQAWYLKAAALAKSENHEDAVSCYEAGLKLDPSNAAAWFNLGHSLGFLGRHNDVVKCCDHALKIHSKYSPLWILKGLGYVSMENFNDAMTCFEQAERLGDHSASAHKARCKMSQAELYFELGSRYQQEGNHTEAIRCYEKGLALNPKNGVIWNNLGAALLASKRGVEAVASFDRAIALNVRDASAWNNKGCALLTLGKQSEGWTCLQEAKRLRT